MLKVYPNTDNLALLQNFDEIKKMDAGFGISAPKLIKFDQFQTKYILLLTSVIDCTFLRYRQFKAKFEPYWTGSLNFRSLVYLFVTFWALFLSNGQNFYIKKFGCGYHISPRKLPWDYFKPSLCLFYRQFGFQKVQNYHCLIQRLLCHIIGEKLVCGHCE